MGNWGTGFRNHHLNVAKASLVEDEEGDEIPDAIQVGIIHKGTGKGWESGAVKPLPFCFGDERWWKRPQKKTPTPVTLEMKLLDALGSRSL